MVLHLQVIWQIWLISEINNTKIHHKLSGMSSNKQTQSMEHYLFIKIVNWREMGYLFCTMSSTEIIGSLITLSLWSCFEGQAPQGIEKGSVCSHGSPCSSVRLAPGDLTWPVDSVSHRGSSAAGDLSRISGYYHLPPLWLWANFLISMSWFLPLWNDATLLGPWV